MEQKHKVVILGGGFGGLAAAQKLKRAPVAVTFIDRRNFHLFQPLLYQVATGSLSPGEIAAPLRSVLSRQKNVRVLLGEAVEVDPEAKRVILRDGDSYPYDSLIVATGSQTSYYGNDAWRQWAPSLKSVEEATAIRHKILYAFERAERAATVEEERAWLTFVIVGAGATGLELSGALAEIARETLRHDFRKIRPQEARILLLEGAPRVLGGYPEDFSAFADKSSGYPPSTRGAPSNNRIRASCGRIFRKSCRNVSRAISASAPESSSPVAPAPTMTNVNHARASSSVAARSARSNAYRILCRMAVASSTDLRLGAHGRHESLP